jgi:hypothetical protein
MKKIVRLTEADLTRLVKKVIEEQTQDVPSDDEPEMKRIVDSQLLKQGFIKQPTYSQSGTKEMCKTAYIFENNKGKVFFMLRCCAPKDIKGSSVVKCGHVGVGVNKTGAPEMVKNFNINTFAMDSNDGSGRVMFALSTTQLQNAINYAILLKNKLSPKK